MAENRRFYYLKLKEGFYNSETMVVLESMPDGLLYSNLLLKMYLMSLKSGGILMLNEHLPHTVQTIATFTRHQIGTVERAIKVFMEFGLVEVLTDGAFYMADIQLLIGQSSTEGERPCADHRLSSGEWWRHGFYTSCQWMPYTRIDARCTPARPRGSRLAVLQPRPRSERRSHSGQKCGRSHSLHSSYSLSYYYLFFIRGRFSGHLAASFPAIRGPIFRWSGGRFSVHQTVNFLPVSSNFCQFPAPDSGT